MGIYFGAAMLRAAKKKKIYISIRFPEKPLVKRQPLQRPLWEQLFAGNLVRRALSANNERSGIKCSVWTYVRAKEHREKKTDSINVGAAPGGLQAGRQAEIWFYLEKKGAGTTKRGACSGRVMRIQFTHHVES